jgi:KipI family sensor histidine kinase inhibitor
LRFVPAGDLAVSVEFEERISVEVNTLVRALEFLIQDKGLPGVVETVPSFRALLVYYDPLVVEYEAFCDALRNLAGQAEHATLPPSRTVELPCCYEDPELGVDLAPAAARLGLSEAELVRLHAGTEQLVYFIGFTPGLPYMGGMPERIHLPRLETPRTKVPAGSVGIGGAQCCIYSVESPGGYWLLGRTPLPLYDPDAAEPVLLRPGDRVRFRPITRREFDAIAAEASASTAGCAGATDPGGRPRKGGEAHLRVIEPGPLTTVQDLGRTGQLRYGVPPSGPMDCESFVLGNRLVGNPDGAAGLECTYMGPRFQVDRPCAIAVTGAPAPVTVNNQPAPRWATIALNAGDTVRIGAPRAGVLSYVAFSGGLDVPLVLGSRSTYVRGRLGGLEGRALRAGDGLRLGEAPLPPARAVAEPPSIGGEAETVVRVVLGPQADRFTDEGIRTLLGSAYEMTPQSDRMGARLRGPRIVHARGHDIISDGIAPGSIQVPGDGQPIVLLADRQSTGGYTKVATVCSFDIGRLGQVKPGQRVRFQALALEEAHRTLRARQATLAGALARG